METSAVVGIPQTITLHTRSQCDHAHQLSMNYLMPTPTFKGGLSFLLSHRETLYLFSSHFNAVDDLWFHAENTQNACIPMSVRRSASHLSPEFTTWESAWMIISWQWGIGYGLGLLPCIYAVVITMSFFTISFWFLNIWPSVRSMWKCLQILTLHKHEWEWQFGLFGLVRMCNASLVLPQSYSLRHENPFFHPWLCLYCLVEAKLFLFSVWWLWCWRMWES